MKHVKGKGSRWRLFRKVCAAVAASFTVQAAAAETWWQLNLRYDQAGLYLEKAEQLEEGRKLLTMPGLEGSDTVLDYDIAWYDSQGGLLLKAPIHLPLGTRVALDQEASLLLDGRFVSEEGALVLRVPGPDTAAAPEKVVLIKATGTGPLQEDTGLPPAFLQWEQEFSLHLPSAFASEPVGPIGVEKVVDSGPDDNRLVLVVMGDGYTAADLAAGEFADDVDGFIEDLFLTNPWRNYSNAVNVYRVDIESAESGSDYEDGAPGSGGTTKDTYLNSQFWYGNTERCVYLNGTGISRAFAAADAEVGAGTWDEILVFVNSTKYGGCAASVGVSSVHPSAGEIQIHEMGHSVAGLADEYAYGSSGTNCFPSSRPNLDCSTNFPSVKWDIWKDAGVPIPTPVSSQFFRVVGAFEGAQYQARGYYRPMYNCKMRALGVEFCPVCREEHVLDLLRMVDLVDGVNPAEGPVSIPAGGSRTFSADSVLGYGMNFDWYLGGTLFAVGTNPVLSLAASQVPGGLAELHLRVSHTSTNLRSEAFSEDYFWMVAGGSVTSGYAAMNLAGTFNNWDPTYHDMDAVSDHTWESLVLLESEPGAEFKFVANENWATNWGDNSQSGHTVPLSDTATLLGGNIVVEDFMDGIFRFRFNDQTLAYSVDWAAPRLAWVGGVYHWPFTGELDAGEPLFINVESWPGGAAAAARVTFTVDDGTAWTVTNMVLGAPSGANDHWYVQLGPFACGTRVEYAVEVLDVLGDSVWQSNFGANYVAPVNGCQAVQWFGNRYHWPTDGQLDAGEDLWINIESWPRGSVVSASVYYVANGGTWHAVPMTREVLGNNDHWYVSLGSFPAGAHIEYAVQLVDTTGTVHWDSLFGANHHVYVNP